LPDPENTGVGKHSAQFSLLTELYLGLGAICVGLGPVGLVSGLGPLRLVETFCAGAASIL